MQERVYEQITDCRISGLQITLLTTTNYTKDLERFPFISIQRAARLIKRYRTR
jgi:hypothetical protein